MRIEKKKIPPVFLALGVRPGLFWKGLLWSLWAIVVAVLYFKKSPGPVLSVDVWFRLLPPLAQTSFHGALVHAGHLGWLAVFALITTGIGRPWIRLFRGSLNAWETVAFAFGIGSASLGLMIMLLGFFGLLRPGILQAFTALLLFTASWLNRDLIRKAPKHPSTQRSAPSGIAAWIFLGLAAFPLLLSGFYALAPTVFYDALVYHLAIPSRYLLEGGMVATPTNLYSGVPMHQQMLFAWALAIDGEILANLVHWIQGAGLLCLFMGVGVRHRSPLAGALAAAAFFSTPLAGMNLWKATVDAGSAFAVLLSVHAAALAVSETEGFDKRNTLILAGFMAGIAMSMKYTLWPVGIVLCLALFLSGERGKNLGFFTLTATVVVVPWVIKNLYFYHNPVFPYYHEMFNPLSPFPVDWKGLQVDAWGRDWGLLFKGGWRTVGLALAHPWTLTMTGNSDADFFGPIFLMALPGFIVFRASNREGRFWVSALLGIWLAWWPFTAMGRFFLPGLALFSAWIGLALCRLPGVWVRGAVMTTVAIVCLNNTMWLAALAGPIRAWDYLLGKETREAFLRAPRSTYPTPSFSAMNWINHHAPSESRVLVEGDARGFYLARPFLASSIFDTNLFAKWVKESGSPSDLLKRFQAERVNYLLVNMGEIMRLNRATPLSHRDLDVAEAFLQEYTDELFSDLNQKQEEFRWAIVYGISGERRKPREEPPPLVSFYRRQIAKNEAG